MTGANILLAIEAMSELDEMALAAREQGYSLRVLAEDARYYGETFAEVVEFPTRDDTELENYVRENLSSIAQVFSVTDTWGVIASKLRDRFGFHQFGDTAKLEFFRDKQAVENELIARGFARPSEASQSGPKIMKLRSGTGKIGVHLVESEAAISEVVLNSGHSGPEFVVQDFYFGPAYSAEVWRDTEREIFFGVTNRILSEPPFFTEKVKSFPWVPDSNWERGVKDWVFGLLRALDYTLGQAHVEFIETTEGFRLVEINARMAGAMITPGILRTTNFNPYAMAVNQALGVAPCSETSREIQGGFSHVSIYADRTGTIRNIRGIDTLARFPGSPQWFPSRGQGDVISELGTYKSRIGNVAAIGETASIAQDRAISASQAIKVEIAED